MPTHDTGVRNSGPAAEPACDHSNRISALQLGPFTLDDVLFHREPLARSTIDSFSGRMQLIGTLPHARAAVEQPRTYVGKVEPTIRKQARHCCHRWSARAIRVSAPWVASSTGIPYSVDRAKTRDHGISRGTAQVEATLDVSRWRLINSRRHRLSSPISAASTCGAAKNKVCITLPAVATGHVWVSPTRVGSRRCAEVAMGLTNRSSSTTCFAPPSLALPRSGHRSSPGNPLSTSAHPSKARCLVGCLPDRRSGRNQYALTESKRAQNHRSAFLGASIEPTSHSKRQPLRSLPASSSQQRKLSPVAVASASWRYPDWISDRLRSPARKQVSRRTPSETAPRQDLAPPSETSWRVLVLLATNEMWTTAQRTHKRRLLLKVFATGILSFAISNCWAAYRIANDISSQAVSEATRAELGRDATVGRLRRLTLPASAHFGRTSLAEPNEQVSGTAPEFVAKSVRVSLGGFRSAIRGEGPLTVDVALHRPTILLSQKTELDANGKTLAKWDPGLPESKTIVSTEHKSEPKGLHVASSNETFDVDAQSGKAMWKNIVPRHVRIQNASVLLQPAELPDYGQGPELVEIRKASGLITLSTRVSPQKAISFDKLHASVTGLPVGGGLIKVDASADVEQLMRLQTGDPVIDIFLQGKNIQARQVAAFLNLPFRADKGRCDGDMKMRFFYNVDDMIPEMDGSVGLRDVSLRFHPDPKTPEFTQTNGKLRFNGKSMFMENPTGILGSLPMSMSGSIDLIGEYNLHAIVPSIDVNNVIDSFDIDKFVPVQGQLRGEATMTGILEEPVISGRAVTTTPAVFDKLPVDSAAVDFQWDSIPGILRLSDISAEVTSGGRVTGSGAMYFDMTRITPWDMQRPTHHPDSPKALYWNPGAAPKALLPPEPADEFDIDHHAASRPYDSMRFDFVARNLNGPELLRTFGGNGGELSRFSVGTVEGEAVIAGHAKNANCRAFWRTTSDPPPVHILPAGSQVPEASETSAPRAGSAAEAEKAEQENRIAPEYFAPPPNQLLEETKSMLSNGKNGVSPNVPGPSSIEGQKRLGGGDFHGVAFLKLGDLPAARRVKMRTTVSNYDARRAAWGDMSLRAALAAAPAFRTSVDTYFKGVMKQQPIVEPGLNPRTPRNELLGVDGALAVKNLRVNNVQFPEAMTGSFKFSTTDFAMSLLEKRLPSSRTQDRPDEASSVSPRDELKVRGSTAGKAFFSMRKGRSELVASLAENEMKKTVYSLFARYFDVGDLLGSSPNGENGMLTGLLDADVTLNADDVRGEGNFSLQRARFASLPLSSAEGKFRVRDGKVDFERLTTRIGNSEQQVQAQLRLPTQDGVQGLAFDVVASMPRTSISNISSMIENASRRSSRRRGRQAEVLPSDTGNKGASETSGTHRGDTLFDIFGSLSDADGFEDSWVMPNVPLDEQLALFEAFETEERERMRRETQVRGQAALPQLPTATPKVTGTVGGTIRASYDSNRPALRPADAVNATVPVLLLQAAGKTAFQFEVQFNDLVVGGADLGQVSARGTYADGKLQFSPLSVRGPGHLEASGSGAIGVDGRLEGFVFVKNAPVRLFGQSFAQLNQVQGTCLGRVDLSGTLLNPRVLSKIEWHEASLNGKPVTNARGLLQFNEGRCDANVTAFIGGKPSREDEAQFDVTIPLTASSMKETEVSTSQKGTKGSRWIPAGSGSRRLGEPLSITASVPARLYAAEFMEKRLPLGLKAAFIRAMQAEKSQDDGSVVVDVAVKNNGMLLLNAFLPKLGKVGGSSSINLHVRGTAEEPVVSGRVNISDAMLSPRFLAMPVENIRGDVLFEDSGIIDVRYLTGRYNGRAISISGALPFAEKNLAKVEEAARKRIPPQREIGRSRRKALIEAQSSALATADRVSKGIVVDAKELVIDLKDKFLGRVSGRVIVKGFATRPSLSGSVNVWNGAAYVDTPVLSPEKALSTIPSVVSQVVPAVRNRLFAGEPSMSSAVDAVGKASNTADKAGQRSEAVTPHADARDTEGRSSVIGPNLSFDQFTVGLGKGLEVVLPYVLSIEANGSVTFDGKIEKPTAVGEIRLPRGEINLVTSRLGLSEDMENKITFEQGSDVTDPRLSIGLEDQDIRVQVANARLSTWADELSITSKRSGATGGDAVVDVVQERLGEIKRAMSSGTEFSRLLYKYLSNTVSLNRRVGPLRWRLFPALTGSGSKELNPVENDLRDAGVGAEFSLGKATVTVRKGLDGSTTGGISIRPKEGVKLEVGSNGPMLSLELDATLPATGPPKGIPYSLEPKVYTITGENATGDDKKQPDPAASKAEVSDSEESNAEACDPRVSEPETAEAETNSTELSEPSVDREKKDNQSSVEKNSNVPLDMEHGSEQSRLGSKTDPNVVPKSHVPRKIVLGRFRAN